MTSVGNSLLLSLHTFFCVEISQNPNILMDRKCFRNQKISVTFDRLFEPMTVNRLSMIYSSDFTKLCQEVDVMKA